MEKIDGFEQFVKKQRQNLESKKGFVETQFENMRSKIEKMIDSLNEKVKKFDLNESEISESEKELGIQPQD